MHSGSGQHIECVSSNPHGAADACLPERHLNELHTANDSQLCNILRVAVHAASAAEQATGGLWVHDPRTAYRELSALRFRVPTPPHLLRHCPTEPAAAAAACLLSVASVRASSSCCWKPSRRWRTSAWLRSRAASRSVSACTVPQVTSRLVFRLLAWVAAHAFRL